MAKVREKITKSARTAMRVDIVVKAVEHAVTARKPKTRYFVGWGARLWLMLNLLPDRWRDNLILSGIRE
jgi:hypothetical protein